MQLTPDTRPQSIPLPEIPLVFAKSIELLTPVPEEQDYFKASWRAENLTDSGQKPQADKDLEKATIALRTKINPGNPQAKEVGFHLLGMDQAIFQISKLMANDDLRREPNFDTAIRAFAAGLIGRNVAEIKKLHFDATSKPPEK